VQVAGFGGLLGDRLAVEVTLFCGIEQRPGLIEYGAHRAVALRLARRLRPGWEPFSRRLRLVVVEQKGEKIMYQAIAYPQTNHSSLSRKTLLLVALIAVLVSSFAYQVNTAQAASCASYYTVKRGDTLYKIGLKYGLLWTVIAKANNIKDGNKIYTGQVLCIPKSGGTGGIPTDPNADVQYVRTLTDVNIRKGPGMSYTIREILRAGKTVQVLGVSQDEWWYEIACPAGLSGECWITANGRYVRPAAAPDEDPIPTFGITAVTRNRTVTIKTADFPMNADFVVMMGKMGTKGINGIEVTKVNSGKGGELSFTFDIPKALRNQERIAIRLENSDGQFAYNWFWNNTTK
jgi:LysM repeat protein